MIANLREQKSASNTEKKQAKQAGNAPACFACFGFLQNFYA